MKTIYLLRHAKSSWKDSSQDDFDRPLNGRGRRSGERMGRYLSENGIHPDLILCSPARRTLETLDLIRPFTGEDTPIRIEETLYLAESSGILAHLESLPPSLRSAMVIAHNPGIHHLALALAADGDPREVTAMAAKFPTAGLAILTSKARTWKSIAARSSSLERFVRPGDLEEA